MSSEVFLKFSVLIGLPCLSFRPQSVRSHFLVLLPKKQTDGTVYPFDHFQWNLKRSDWNSCNTSQSNKSHVFTLEQVKSFVIEVLIKVKYLLSSVTLIQTTSMDGIICMLEWYSFVVNTNLSIKIYLWRGTWRRLVSWLLDKINDGAVHKKKVRIW